MSEKIYVAYGTWNYEGNDSPAYAGTDLKKAQKRLQKENKLMPYSNTTIEVWVDGKKVETL